MRVATGTRLGNGAVVIASSRDIVLASFRQEYVTWSIDALGACFSGRYFTSAVEAMRDFTRRVSL